MVKGQGRDKAGYNKIKFCGKQAARDGLRTFWVDSCCIDKSNDGEHQQAIQSMFRWYYRASRCYAYLSDVSASPSNDNEAQGLVEFQKSVWFTRGWTLQELLAPASIDFFSRDGVWLGDKQSLLGPIHRRTGISISARERLTRFTDIERFTWIERRKTKFEEDLAYSLQGIFDVCIPIRYGEGRANAFKRLENEIAKQKICIQDLHITDPRDDKKRIEDTKGGLLEDAYYWIFQNNDWRQWRGTNHQQLLWIKGDSGKGKTMLLCGIINELERSMTRSESLSYFFCQATDSRINTATAVLRGLLYLLVDQQPSLVSHLQKRHDYVGKKIFEDTNSWFILSEIFADILRDSRLETVYLVIDALDECTIDLDRLLSFVVHSSSSCPRVKWLVSSRNWGSIEEQLERVSRASRLSLELNSAPITEAVGTYIQHKVDHLALSKKYDLETRESVLNHLKSNAQDTFLWVALVCQNLEKVHRRNVRMKLSMFPHGLDSIYERMIKAVTDSDDSTLLKQILALIATVYEPITLVELASLVESLHDVADDMDTLQDIIGECGSFLTVRNERIFFVHQSAKDYLLAYASVEIFPHGFGDMHHSIFVRSLNVMLARLQRDSYDIRAPGCLIDQIETPSPDPLAALRYLSVYWIDHACEWTPSPSDYVVEFQDGGIVASFLQDKYLYWLEALSLCRNMSRGVLGMAKLEMLVQKRSVSPMLYELARDAYRFIMHNKPAIEISPLQTYVSALIFTPSNSIVRRSFDIQGPEWIICRPAITSDWSACLLALESHSASVTSLAFSPDSKQVVSGSHDKTVKLWDAESGAVLFTFQGHRDSVTSVAFSPDGKYIASGSDDCTIRLWEAESGAAVSTLNGHRDFVRSVVFSPDGRRVASGSHDNTVRLWDTKSGVCLEWFEGPTLVDTSITFLPNGKWIASGTYGRIMKLWDADFDATLSPPTVYSGSDTPAAFSVDGNYVVSGLYDWTIKLRDVKSGAVLSTFTGHSGPVTSVAFSRDGQWIASGSEDRTIRLWDASTGTALLKLSSHSDSVKCVAISPNRKRIASGSTDRTVRLWDAESDAASTTVEGHSQYVNSVALSPDGKRGASGSNDRDVRLWDTDSGATLAELKGHSDNVISVMFSPNGKQIASASNDRTIRLWDADSGAAIRTLEGHNHFVNSIAFSADGKRIASASDDRIVKLWDVETGVVVANFEGHTKYVRSVAFSADGKRVVSGSNDRTVRIWDAESGAVLHMLEGHRETVKSVAFSLDGEWIASGSYDMTIKLWNSESGAMVQTLPTDFASNRLSFSPDGTRLKTDRGYVSLGLSDAVSHQLDQADLFVVDQWILLGSQRLLRLPASHHASCAAAKRHRLLLGHSSGLVSFYRFDVSRLRML